jgi:hypothetical protein
LNTDLEIYQARVARAQERIDTDRRAGRSASTLDVHRLEMNLKLIAAIREQELVEVEA